MLPANEIRNQRRRVLRARRGNGSGSVTCPASRHVQNMADALTDPRHGDALRYPMLQEEPEHCAGSLYAVLESLWKARAELAVLKRKKTEQRNRRILRQLDRDLARQRGFISPQLAGLLAVAAIIAGLTIWALVERSGRLACAVERQQFQDAYGVLASKAQEQSAAVAELGRKGAAAREAGRQAQIAAEAMAKERDAELARLGVQIAAPTPAGQDCRDVWQTIRGQVLGEGK